MGLLREATVEQAAAKVGLFGTQGSGKTTTSMLMAIGLSKTYHNGAPIVFMDTESGSDFMVPICKAEGIKLLVVKSRSFQDMKAMLREGEEAGACVALVDSYTHPWKELNDALKKKLRVSKIEFKHMDQLKSMWQGWTDLMLNSPLHVLMSGRLGYVWDREEDDENGKKGDLIKLGTKMKAESDAGYEPSLLIEMEGVQTEAGRAKQSRSKKGTITHYAYVLKDRWRTLNGKTLTFKDLNGYKAGDYRKVFDAFRPHFDQLAIGSTQRSVDPSRSSEAMFDGAGDSAFQQRARRVQITLEEFDGTLNVLWPGSSAKEKALKNLIIETLFATRSWSAVESMSLEALEAGLGALRLFEEGVKSGAQTAALTDPAQASGFAALCKEQVATAARDAQETVGIL
jgi:hypothetical protein